MAPLAGPLVYDRVGQNRRRTWLLVILAFALLLPAILAAGYLLSHVAVLILAAISGEFRHGVADRMMAVYHQHLLRFAAVTTSGVVAVLGVLFWAIASSPGARLLVQVGARPAAPDESGVSRLLENLAIGAGLPQPKLYVSDSTAPNAFAVGAGPAHAAIVVTTGALRLLDRRELEGVLAHELSHIGNHDILLNTVVASIGLFLRFLAPGTLFIGPLLVNLIRAFISREREFLADADAALLTRFPQGLVRALAKIGSAGSAIRGCNSAYSHFYFAEATSTAGPWFGSRLLTTHPPAVDRIRRLMEFQEMDALVPLESAIRAGRRYRETHPFDTRIAASIGEGRDEFASLCQGNPMGRVFRVMADVPMPVYYQPDARSEVVAYLEPGKLVVAFDDPGPFRQVSTADWTFGYVSRSVGLDPVPDLIPSEVFDQCTSYSCRSATKGSSAIARRVGK